LARLYPGDPETPVGGLCRARAQVGPADAPRHPSTGGPDRDPADRWLPGPGDQEHVADHPAAQQVAFTSPYAGLFLGVYGSRGVPVKSPADLGARKVGLSRGTTQDLSLTEMAPRASIVRFEDDATSAAAFLSGQTDLIATANIVALDLIKKNPAKNIELKFVIRLSPAHIAIRHGEPDMLRWLDTFIFFHKLNGDIGKLHEKWFNEKMQDLPTF
jgi:polar amino acid transport system substrate-binding protein